MKKLTFIVPIYNTETFIVDRLSHWKSVSKLVELIFIEDKLEGNVRKIADKVNAKYFNKANGNWGSVINFAKNNKVINTKYMAVVDPDDTINIVDLQNLIDNLDDNDLYVTDLIIKNYKTQKVKTKTWSNRNGLFVHQTWVKTEIFNKINDLPEGYFFMDAIFATQILENTYSYKYLQIAPYNYFVSVPGQSTQNQKLVIRDSVKSESMKIVSDYFINYSSVIDMTLPLNSLLKREIKKHKNQYVKWCIRASYDSPNATKKDLQHISLIYKKWIENYDVTIFDKLIWSKLYRIFTIKIAK